jgi:adenylate kinase
MKLVLTGTPGTGKTFLAKKIARARSLKLIDVKKLVEEKNFFYKKQGEREKTVDLTKLERELKKIFLREKNVLAESHLLCEFALKCDKAIVLRCNPFVLARRLRKRGYSKQKVFENVLCEALDYCSVNAIQNYGGIVEINCTRLPSTKTLLKKISGNKGDKVRWRTDLTRIAFNQRI